MSKRQLITVAIVVVLVAVAAVSAGVAFGSRAAAKQNPPSQKEAGPPPARRSSTNDVKPKAQAYVYFWNDGTILTSKKVVAVYHYYTGEYCVQLAPNLHVNDHLFIQMTVNWNGSPTYNTFIPERIPVDDSLCTDSGYPNSFFIGVWRDDNGSTDMSDAALYVTIP